MSLDPQVRDFLDMVEEFGRPPFEQGTPEAAREQVVEDTRALGPPEPLHATEDRLLPGPAGDIPVRIYSPCDATTLPAMVYYHGGGWVVGDVETHDNLCSQIANRANCRVISVEYRRAPEHKYPAAVDDAYAATEWIFQHADEFGVDRNRIAIGGDSAGGNLAAVVALRARDRRAFRPVLQVLTYPVTDCRFDTQSYEDNAEGYLLTRDTMRWFWDCYLEAESQGDEPDASPLRAATLAGLPPALIQTAEYDPLRDEGEAYAERLRAAGVPVTLTRYAGMIHAFIRLTSRFDQAQVAVDEVAGALRGAFSGESAREATP